MRLLLDTHFVLWLATERDQLTPAEFATLDDPETDLAVSAVSIWELKLKWDRHFRSGERKGPVDPARLLTVVRALGLPVEPLTPDLAAASLRDPAPHGDPFDALLLTIAQETGRKLFTRDTKLRGHPLAIHAD